MRTLLLLLFTALLVRGLASPAAAERPNVLLIAADDLNDWIGCLGGHPQAHTPNLDSLAARGTLFANAHCQSPLCNPSRSSLLTGLRPSTTGIYGLAPGIRSVDATKTRITLPQTFTRTGYHSYTCGKIYHDGSMTPKDRAAEFNQWGPAPGAPRPPKPIAKIPRTNPLMDWGPYPERDEDHNDYQIATAAISALRAAPTNQPFFIACGFRQPHVPCFAPPKYFDLYPADTLQMPPVLETDRDDTPRFSWFLHWRLPEPRLKLLREHDEWRPLVRAYLAGTSFMDAQVGRVLKALEETGRATNTVVVFWSDHGWHLGEKLITGKNTLWERSTRVPLIFAGPSIAAKARCARPVELLDLFPTLAELCHLDAPKDLEGHSLTPLLRDAKAPREWPALTTHNHDNHTVRSEQWRFIRYADGTEELYNLRNDPNEWTNVISRTAYVDLKRDLARWLPAKSAPPAPGSRDRILTYDRKTGEAVWENKPIGEGEGPPE